MQINILGAKTKEKQTSELAANNVATLTHNPHAIIDNMQFIQQYFFLFEYFRIEKVKGNLQWATTSLVYLPRRSRQQNVSFSLAKCYGHTAQQQLVNT